MREAKQTTLREDVVSAIRTKIIKKELIPGMRIVEQNLAEELGTSRGPIREALRQLEEEGMVEYIRNAGCTVKLITPEDIYEIYLMRASYEIMAVMLCEEPFSDSEIAEMEQVLDNLKNLQDGDLNGIIACDDALHGMIVRKPGVKRLERAWENLNYGNFIASANSSSLKAGLVLRQYGIHRELVNLCRSGDKTRLREALYRHYMRPVKRLMEESELSPKQVHFSRQMLEDPAITY